MGIIDENIKNVFDNMSYSEQYNYDIWFTIIAIIIVDEIPNKNTIWGGVLIISTVFIETI